MKEISLILIVMSVYFTIKEVSYGKIKSPSDDGTERT